MLTACSAVEPQPEDVLIIPISPNYSGDWELDYGLTESVEEKMRWLYEVTRSQLERNQARDKRRRVRPDIRMKNEVHPIEGLIELGRLTQLVSQANILHIEQRRGDVIVEREGDYSLICSLTSVRSIETRLGREQCRLEGKQLIYTVALPEGLTIEHRLVLSENRQRLNLSTTLFSKAVGQPFSINRVYMPYEKNDGRFRCESTLTKNISCSSGEID